MTVKHEHLATLIRDEMRERKWTLDDLVMNMGPFYTEEAWVICKLSWEMFFAAAEAPDIAPNVALGDEMAQQLADAFDVDTQFFINFHEAWRLSAGVSE